MHARCIFGKRPFVAASFHAVILFVMLLGILAPGLSVAQEQAGSFEQLKALAEKGDAAAQTKLADLYRTGKGVAQNFQEAVKWYSSAAEKGVAEAQFRLGELYGEGKGIAQNAQEAAKWLEKAAAQGHQDAKNKLKELASKAPEGIKDLNKALDMIR